ncbi:MAG: pseudaminic acid synthase [Vampirovibrionales bacterium]|nr:pseudaminic acid synthase [Vampirovibrionales bacterium]
MTSSDLPNLPSDAILIGDRAIGLGHPPWIIAEMSGNHNQSLDRALALVDAAAQAGAHALKIQTYTAETMTLAKREGAFFIENPNSLWQGRSLYELYQAAYTPWEWHEAIFERCRQRGIICFSSPFDASAVDFLESFNPPCYKIASFENIDLPLIRKVAATGRPLIMSTGMATAAELDEAVRAARDAGCRSLILLKCVSAYPAPPENANLRTIPHLRVLFGVEVGLSDHTLGVGVALAAVALGASVIEKHFTLSRADGGVDAAFSMEPEELRLLATESARAWQSLGRVAYGPQGAEAESLVFRRSLYIARDMAAGETLTTENLRCVRPGDGLPPKYYDRLLGRRVVRAVSQGEPLSWDLLLS